MRMACTKCGRSAPVGPGASAGGSLFCCQPLQGREGLCSGPLLQVDRAGVFAPWATPAAAWRRFVGELVELAAIERWNRAFHARGRQWQVDGKRYAANVEDVLRQHGQALFPCDGCRHPARRHAWAWVPADDLKAAGLQPDPSGGETYARGPCGDPVCRCRCFVDPRVPRRQWRALATTGKALPPFALKAAPAPGR